MRYILVVLLLVLGFSGCSSKSSGVSEKEYQRSNAASEKSLDRLDRE
ncbi:MAG: hypothetical protein FAF05_04210 [Epsilonproteobacteria bacterium]|nr:hypothetical protein [Campylobacterota bacterium]